jgi:hypothetical protein
MRRPDLPDDMHLDFYWEQFAEPGDGPEINFHNNNDLYEFLPDMTKSELKKELKRLKKDGEALIKASNYLENYLKKRLK